jgi:hypothetical protein
MRFDCCLWTANGLPELEKDLGLPDPDIAVITLSCQQDHRNFKQVHSLPFRSDIYMFLGIIYPPKGLGLVENKTLVVMQI